MYYNELIECAIEKNQLVQLLRGENGYGVEVSKFTSDVFPTDVNEVLVNCIYKQKAQIPNIDTLFTNAFLELAYGEAADIYTAVLYFDTCIFHEEKGNATFIIDKMRLANILSNSINDKKDELQGEIMFANGMVKQNAWGNINNFNRYYIRKYGFGIVNETPVMK